ncbi:MULTISPECIES: hypothetical protein [unclassified Rhodococcus (in: high G+C Gram-positive bacteria)]|uniref:hypothetical protein n=1 Tax=unclassified Rhodococcus (in: high G+C Gram-positive bacteria) TaxID=192944 RepID=UPI00117AB490|nr:MULTISPECIES: hypothetical protein [unclassified Rhodococcus (in: high G+C Gram-positive bacteria)]
MKPGHRAVPDLLTLNRDRVRRLDGFYDVDRFTVDDEARTHMQHWLFRAAIDVGAITWDIARWGHPEFVAVFAHRNQHELEFAIVYDVRSAPPVVSSDVTAYPANARSLSGDAFARLPSTLIPDPPTELAWLAYLVCRFNDLHRRTAALVDRWPQ